MTNMRATFREEGSPLFCWSLCRALVMRLLMAIGSLLAILRFLAR